MSILSNRTFINESELHALVKVLLEDKSLGPQLVKVNPVVDPSAAVTDPSNFDYKPNTKQELCVALVRMIDDLSDDRVSDTYDSFKDALQKQKVDKGTKQMDKSNKKIEESIRRTIRALLGRIELPTAIKEYYAKDPVTGEMTWKGSGPAPKLSPSADVKKLNLGDRSTIVGAKAPDVNSLRNRLNKLRDEDLTDVDPEAPRTGHQRRNKSGETELKNIAAELGFKNPNGALQFINRVLEKFKSRFDDFDKVLIASLEIMKEYIDELSAPYKSNSKMMDPLITPQDAELMRQHPEMIKDLETFRVYLNKKLRERGL